MTKDTKNLSRRATLAGLAPGPLIPALAADE
jgi:hypothetical protein